MVVELLLLLLLNVELDTSRMSSLGALLNRVENLDVVVSSLDPASRRFRMRRDSRVEDRL